MFADISREQKAGAFLRQRFGIAKEFVHAIVI